MPNGSSTQQLEVTGIEPNSQADLKRAFDFAGATVADDLKKPERLAFVPGHFKVSGDGVFYTVQGEGPSMGWPCCFLRLHICNLRCTWCDAWYTWNPNTPEFWTESQNWSIAETAQKLADCWECENSQVPRRVVITGGEPMLQKDRIDLLVQALPDWIFEVETNGTIMPTPLMLEKFQFNCSPKLRNSTNHVKARIKPEVLQTLNRANAVFKFVVMTPEDLDEIEQDFVQGLGLDVTKILVMPQGVTAEEVHHNAQRVIEATKRKGYRILGRLQNEIWGAKRRV